ncbi:FKBP-type peptidyl-prolyl cis-trans isomerase [Sphingobacterium paucimobilis]|nr:hypothetical protein [Sphingobacterium paucimobilis]
MKDSLPFKNNLYSMKNLFKTVLFAALGAIVFVSCNKKDDYDYEGEALKVDRYIDSLLRAEKIKIDEYMSENSDVTWIADTLTYPFYFLDKKTPRGIHYAILNEATDDSYEYKFNSSNNPIAPEWKLKYNVHLLTGGDAVQSDLEGGKYNMSNPNTPNPFTEAWIISLFPSQNKVNGNIIPYKGLTEKGQKKGSKIRVIVPSLYAYGSLAKKADGKVFLKDIPANSPLVYEFDIMEIQ